ncbi:hypothetical protein RF11_08173 [Thelohanellus kitauei]|uniref:Uncharacterized protein n=1 Tax=Thelohanellus kitauei TaxID=669202 RepID=A0A0C2NG66_THEKT|nr:hypothetical protein RF11_08173 [Thelohanellus kitauei]
MASNIILHFNGECYLGEKYQKIDVQFCFVPLYVEIKGLLSKFLKAPQAIWDYYGPFKKVGNYKRYQAIRRSVEKFDKNQSSLTCWINTGKGPCTTYRAPRVVFIVPEFKLDEIIYYVRSLPPFIGPFRRNFSSRNKVNYTYVLSDIFDEKECLLVFVNGYGCKPLFANDFSQKLKDLLRERISASFKCASVAIKSGEKVMDFAIELIKQDQMISDAIDELPLSEMVR